MYLAIVWNAGGCARPRRPPQLCPCSYSLRFWKLQQDFGAGFSIIVDNIGLCSMQYCCHYSSNCDNGLVIRACIFNILTSLPWKQLKSLCIIRKMCVITGLHTFMFNSLIRVEYIWGWRTQFSSIFTKTYMCICVLIYACIFILNVNISIDQIYICICRDFFLHLFIYHWKYEIDVLTLLWSFVIGRK